MKMRIISVINVFLAFIFNELIVQTNGYKVEMTIAEDDAEQILREIEVVDHDNPPFEIEYDVNLSLNGKKTFLYRSYTNILAGQMNETSEQDHFQNGVKISGLLGNVRNKRSLERKPEGCVRNDGRSKYSRTANHAVTVETGETIHLPCHECDADESEIFQSMQWIRLDLFPNSKGLYHIKEVVVDTHDEEKMNRVSVTLDHTLVIKKAKLSDAGSYFCRLVEGKRSFMNLRLGWNDLLEFITNESHMSYFFRVDVIDLKHRDTIDVSSYSKKKPLEPEVVPLLNIEVTTRWYPWSSCSVCNEDGIRKRMGICVIKKPDSSANVQNNYLRNIVNFDERGVPCQSQVLRDFQNEQWLQRPNLIQIEECNVPCRESTSKRTKRGLRSFMSRKEVIDQEKQAKIDKKNAKKKAKKKTIRVGAYLILKCPGISLTKTVNWVRGSNLINAIKVRKFSNDRITMDMFGNLHFKEVTLKDNGIYSCWLSKKMKYKYEVKVKEDRRAEIRTYTIYLCVSFICDFVVFTVLAVVKFLQRRVQRRRRKTRKNSDNNSDVRSESSNKSNRSESNNKSNKKDIKNKAEDDDDGTSSSSSDSDSD